MDLGTLLVALTVGIAPLAFGIAAGYLALAGSLAVFKTALEQRSPVQALLLDNVVQMPIRGRITVADVAVRRAS